MWLNLLSMGVKTASHIYQNKQKTKRLMSDAQAVHAEKMAKGEIEYKAKVIESNDKGWKDEFVLVLVELRVSLLGRFFAAFGIVVPYRGHFRVGQLPDRGRVAARVHVRVTHHADLDHLKRSSSFFLGKKKEAKKNQIRCFASKLRIESGSA